MRWVKFTFNVTFWKILLNFQWFILQKSVFVNTISIILMGAMNILSILRKIKWVINNLNVDTSILILFQIIMRLLQFNICCFQSKQFFVKICNKYCQLAMVHIITMTASPLGMKCLLPRNLILLTDVILNWNVKVKNPEALSVCTRTGIPVF